MDVFQALVYGILQGLGEFLPISSTAHLTLAPWLFGWKDPGLTFDVALHMGTLFAVVLFFYKDWIRLIRAGFTDVRSKDGRLFWFLMLACIPGGIIGVLFEDQVATVFRSQALIAAALIVMGIVLYAADKVGRSDVKLENVGFFRSMMIGVSQALAVIPGVSRSGITIVTGRLFGMSREAAARFTFLLSTPFIFCSGVYKAKDLKDVHIDMAPFLIAIMTSAIVGAISIKFLLNYLKKKGYGIFTVYRIILGVIVLAVFFLR